MNTDGFVAGGYFLTRPVVRDDAYMATDLLPPRFVALSGCLADFVDDPDGLAIIGCAVSADDRMRLLDRHRSPGGGAASGVIAMLDRDEPLDPGGVPLGFEPSSGTPSSAECGAGSRVQRPERVPTGPGRSALLGSSRVDYYGTVRLELTRKTDLALRALQALARTDGLRKGGDLADELGTSAGFLVQVLAPLASEGWVRSVPGPRGGYHVTRTAADVSVLALIEAVEGPVEADRCVLREQQCPALVPCALHDAWIPARDALLERLAATPVLATAAHDS